MPCFTRKKNLVELEFYLVLEFRQIEYLSIKLCLYKKKKKKHVSGTRVYKTRVPHKSSFKDLIGARNYFFFACRHQTTRYNQKHTEIANNQKQRKQSLAVPHTIYIYIYISFEVNCIKKMQNATNPTSTMGRE